MQIRTGWKKWSHWAIDSEMKPARNLTTGTQPRAANPDNRHQGLAAHHTVSPKGDPNTQLGVYDQTLPHGEPHPSYYAFLLATVPFDAVTLPFQAIGYRLFSWWTPHGEMH